LTEAAHVDVHLRHKAEEHRQLNEFVHRGAMPPVANDPAASQSFDRGAHTGREAAQSRQAKDFNNPRRE
jgi:hypothetical protein